MIFNFKKHTPEPIPEECKGLEIKTESSICTGETTIGFYDPKIKRLRCAELVRNREDIENFYKRYGIEQK